jgi:hypothetical protein
MDTVHKHSYTPPPEPFRVCIEVHVSRAAGTVDWQISARKETALSRTIEYTK